MTEFVVPILYTLMGLCGFAGGYHLIKGLRVPRNRATILFAAVGLIAVPYALSQIACYQASSVPEYVNALRWNLATILLLDGIFLWFIAEYTSVGSRPFLWVITAWLALLFAINLEAPHTIQYAADPRIVQFRLPWGETLASGVGDIGPWFRVSWVSITALNGFWVYSLFTRYRRMREASALILAVATAIGTLAHTEAALVREGILQFVELGPIGLLSLIVTISLVLDYQSWYRLRSSEARFRQLVEQCPLSIEVYAPDGRVSLVNPGSVKLWGVTKNRLADYNILADSELAEKGAMPFIKKAFAGTAAEVPPIRYTSSQNEIVVSPFRQRWICAHVYPVKDDKGCLCNVIMIHEDVTKRKQVEDAIRHIAAGVSAAHGQEFFRQLVQSLAEIFDVDSTYLGVLDEHEPGRVRTLAAWTRGEIVPDWGFQISGTPSARVLDNQICVFPRDVQRKFPNDTMLAQMGAASYAGVPLKNIEGKAIGLIGIIDDKCLEYPRQAREILEIFAVRASAELQRLEAEARIRRMAYEDDLTGLGSRAYLQKRLTEALTRARRTGQYGALVLMDLDHFKIVNDALSHEVGDDILRAVGHRVNEAAGDQAVVARFGGDEFVALLDTYTDDIEVAKRVAQDLAQRIGAQLARPIVLGERALTVDASIGIVVFPTHEETDLDVVRHADMALNSAKRQGRGNAKFYDPTLLAAATERLHVDEGLRKALANDELALYFQPQVSATGEVVGSEALLRWHHPQMGNISPGTFVPIAEESGLIHSLGQWVLTQACSQLHTWRRDHVPFGSHLSINVSAWQFIIPGFVAQVRELMAAHGLEPRQLMLELTETSLLYDLEDTIAKLRELRTLGIGISLDDFGTGFSSLAYLKDLPLDQLKIDKSFIAGLRNTEDAPLVGAIIAIGRHMHLDVVAEGVETQRQRELLERMGCRKHQGYLFSRPLPDEDFRRWLTVQAGRVGA